MYLMYVDESGDSGIVRSPTRYYVLCGLVIHELCWQAYLDRLIQFRRDLKRDFGLRLRDEFHAGAMLTSPGEDLVRIEKHKRLQMIRLFADLVGSLRDWSVINVVVDKCEKPEGYDVFGMAWRALLQRFQNTITHRNFPGPANPEERGILICDHTEDAKLSRLVRQMRRFNPVPNQPCFGPGTRNLPLTTIVDDPNFRDSATSYFVQAVDLLAFLLYQHHAPSAYMRKKGGARYVERVRPIFCLHAAPRDPDGIVRI